MITQEQRRRMIKALDETNTLLAREMRYSAEHRNLKLIAFYHSHIAKLETCLKNSTMPVMDRI